MIELDIKIRAKNHDNLKMLIEAMTDSLQVANTMGKVDVQFTAETDGDKMILTRKEIIIPSGPVTRTPIEDFIDKADISWRVENVLRGQRVGSNFVEKEYPFKYAEDITEVKFMKLPRAGVKAWRELSEALETLNIKY